MNKQRMVKTRDLVSIVETIQLVSLHLSNAHTQQNANKNLEAAERYAALAVTRLSNILDDVDNLPRELGKLILGIPEPDPDEILSEAPTKSVGWFNSVGPLPKGPTLT